jgi:hypothetical protein
LTDDFGVFVDPDMWGGGEHALEDLAEHQIKYLIPEAYHIFN